MKVIFVNSGVDGWSDVILWLGGGVHNHEGQVELAVCESDLAVFGA